MTDIPYLGMFDVKTWLDHNHIPYWESGKNVRTGWIGIKCPWCDDHSNHMGISPSMGINCWRCSTSGTVIKLVMMIMRVDLNTACNVIRDYSTPGVKAKSYGTINQPDVFPGLKLHVDILSKFKFTREMRTFHREFLESRRYDPDIVFDKYRLRFAGPVSDFALRIIIPVIHKNRIVTFVGRTAKNQDPPYKNCPEEDSIISAKNMLYGLDNCRDSSVLVVEGIFDQWRIGDGAVAALGTKTTDAQVLLLKDFKRVFVLFDAEPQAQAAAKYLANKLSVFTEVVRLELDTGDPDDLSEDDVRHLRRQVFGKVY